MTKGSRLKISISLPADLVATLDRRVRQMPGASRSALVEEYLRRGARMSAETDLRNEVISYYESLSTEERLEDESLARATSRAAKQLEFHESASKPRWKHEK